MNSCLKDTSVSKPCDENSQQSETGNRTQDLSNTWYTNVDNWTQKNSETSYVGHTVSVSHNQHWNHRIQKICELFSPEHALIPDIQKHGHSCSKAPRNSVLKYRPENRSNWILGDRPQRIQIPFTLKMIPKYLRVNTRKQTLRNERGTSQHVHTLLKTPGPYCATQSLSEFRSLTTQIQIPKYLI